jgi:valyl-tRNA synthetase
LIAVPEERLKNLEKRTRYEPSEVESRVFARWEEAGIFHPEPEGTAAGNYSIAVPPPNVTGELHMGHALNASIQDVCMRLARMRGRRAKWIYGTDHAGIGTQVKVEEALAAEGKRKEDLGREAFVRRVWEWRERYGSRITEQYKRLGASLDYRDERFTMDERYARAVLLVFVRLYERRLVFRDNYLVNWDPGVRSAISDLEVVQRRVTDTLYLIDYPLASGSGSLTVATVRPETMLADTGVAVNPDDERYSRLVGETAVLPLVGRRLPIIADEHVDPEFGTGALKITPGHDPNDFEIGRRHGLDQVTVIGEDGRITDAAPERFRGLPVDEARREVVAALREEGLVSGTRPFEHDVPHSHRSGMRIEPLISLQWFCDMTELARPAIEAVEQGRLRFHPDRPWTDVYLRWLREIRPWCISRQLWWGHQIPAWYRGDEVYVGEQPPQGEGFERDPDVLDTWFSSALWPFATLGWPQETPELRAFYPTDVLVTARDIIFLWVARMVMFGIEFTGGLPFGDVPVHSVIQAPDGRRMSKSLGTGVDPIEVVDGGPRPPVYRRGGDFPAYGADALRFGLLAMSSGQDVRFNEERVGQGRDLANKLWNASRLVLLGVEGGAEASTPRPETVEDRWIASRLERTTREVTGLLERFEFSRAALRLYDVFWSEFCDWYLELAKPRLYSERGAGVSSILLWALERSLKLLHPLMPFVTEEIWSYVPGSRELLAVAPWPEPDDALLDREAEAVLERTIAAVTELRRFRDEIGARASALIPARLRADAYREVADQMARLARFEFVSDGAEPGAVLFELPIPGGAVEILRSEAFDPDEAARRLGGRRDQLEAEVARSEAKLRNERFLERAPAEVVEAERTKLDEYRAALDRVRAWAGR